jgi:hypothetical protein
MTLSTMLLLTRTTNAFAPGSTQTDFTTPLESRIYHSLSTLGPTASCSFGAHLFQNIVAC